MNICWNAIELQKAGHIARVMEMNNKAVRLLSTYLTECPDFINRELMSSICSDCRMSEEEGFAHLLIATCGLDVEANATDRQLVNDYFIPAVRKLDPAQYRMNPYYRHIHIPDEHLGHWELKHERYLPYEAFVCNDIILEEDFKEIPQIGFFDSEFSFPAVLKNGNEWMAIKPNEIETMRNAVDAVAGRVITFGLGLGYYAYMVSEKPEVESVLIVEEDPEVIALFETHILPQFSNKQKISIVQEDAFRFASCEMPVRKYDFAFTDLWHDVSDGYPLYLKMKKLERLNPATTFLYWIEESLLSHLRWRLFHQMYKELSGNSRKEETRSVGFFCSSGQFIHNLKNSFLKNLAREL